MIETNPDFIYTGETITLRYFFVDTNGDYFDPDDARLTIVRNVNQFVAGPFTYEAGYLTRLDVGQYEYEYAPSLLIVPGTYRAKWEGTMPDEENFVVYYFEFQILDPPLVPSTILDPPRTEGIIRPSPAFHRMGFGATDRLFLVGHAGGLNINDPYQVANVQEAINILGGDHSSPMIRAMLEAYGAGSRDLYLVAAAPQSEYVSFDISDEENRFIPRPEWGNKNFYERYAERLETTYEHLEGNDLPEIVCLLEAPFYDTRGVDFLTPLQNHCTDAFALTGVPRVGIIGTRVVNQTTDDITAMIEDERLETSLDGGKFVTVIVGEGTISLTSLPIAYSCALSTTAAAALSTQAPWQGLVYRKLPNVIGITAGDMTKAQVKALSNAKLNPAIRTELARRGNPYQIVIATDNTLSADGSDFWNLSTTRIVIKVINRMRALGQKYIGSIAYAQFKQEAKVMMSNYVNQNYIRGYDLRIEQSKDDFNRVRVDVMIQPYTTIRDVLFTVEVGLGA